MAPLDLAAIVAIGLTVFLGAGAYLNGRHLRKLERELEADETARRTAAE